MTVTEPLWRRVHDSLRDQILSGELKPGDRLPAEPALMASYGVRGRGTILTAVRALMGEGLLDEGRRVRRHSPLEVHLVPGADSWAADLARAGLRPGQELEVLRTAAPAPVAARLGLREGATVIERRLLRLADGRPHSTDSTWFPAALADDTPLADPADIAEGSVACLEQLTGWALTWGVQIEGRQPGDAERERLAIPPGVPVHDLWWTGRFGSRAILTAHTILPCDRTRLAMDGIFPAAHRPLRAPVGEGCAR